MFFDGLQISKKLNGFGRMIQYLDTTNEGETPENMFYLPEGQIEDGNPSGFTRVIDGYDNVNFVGYMRDW